MVNWERVKDGEYNEHKAVINGHGVTIYSDRDQTEWSCSINDEESNTLQADDLSGAMREAELDAKSMSPKK